MIQTENIVFDGITYAMIIKTEELPGATRFMTPDNFNQQVGYIVYKQGEAIVPHIHHPIQRTVLGTTEVVIVKKGRCLVDFYNLEKQKYAERELQVGDIVVLLGAGHGFRMLEDTVLLEVKQGPFVEGADKERFYDSGK